MNPGESAVFLEDRNLHTTCLDYSGKGAVAIFGCHGLGGNQLWKYSAVGIVQAEDRITNVS